MTSEPKRTVERIGGPVESAVLVPGSKSIANRALVCAALAEGTSELNHVPDGDDVVAMLDSLVRLGVPIESAGPTRHAGAPGEADSPRPNAPGSTTVWVHGGLGAGGVAYPTVLDAHLAGTTSRFLVALASLVGSPVAIDGAEPLRSRPFQTLLDALEQLGVDIEDGPDPGHLPVTVSGPPKGAHVAMRGDVSSQFISALMLIAPRLPHGLEIALHSALVSRPYLDLTAAVMATFGVNCAVDDDHIGVPAGTYQPTTVGIEPDASSASYPFALAAILGGAVTVQGLSVDSLQGDIAFVEILARMGCVTTSGPDGVRVSRAPDVELRGLDIDMSDISDLVPTMAVVAAVATTPTTIRGVGFIRHKESDRLGDLAAELSKLGVQITETADGLRVDPSVSTLRAGTVCTHHDHRIAMAAGVLGSAIGGVEVETPSVVDKSWPQYWSMLDAVGGR